VQRTIVGFCAYCVLRLAGLSASNCKRLCENRLCKALCLDLIGEGGSGKVCVDLMSFAKLALWLCAQENKNVERLKTNKEEKELVDVAPHWGEPCISCVVVLCAMLFILFMYLSA
jgi:hypothetical protein